MAAVKHILALNSGSSSLKFALFRCGDQGEEALLMGAAERIGESTGRLWVESEGRRFYDEIRPIASPKEALAGLFEELRARRIDPPDAIGHRIVAGGPRHTQHCLVDHAVLQDLRQALPFAPLHLPAAIAGIDACQALWPDQPEVACFDIAFHRSIPELAARLPLPRHFWHEGVRKYGFHGLSYEFIQSQLPDRGEAPTIIAHLGNGASMAALSHGCCQDTTMGLTPTGGLVMGTRSGDLDPGVLLYLLAEKGYNAQRLEHLLNHQSGLLGVSACTGDMEKLLHAQETNPHAKEAIALFAYSARKHLASLMGVLGGLQRLVFTGGIGEHASAVRWAICRPLEGLGIALDPIANAHSSKATQRISRPESPVEVLVIPTDEDRMIARHAYGLAFPTPTDPASTAPRS